jgi:hypothetical protein
VRPADRVIARAHRKIEDPYLPAASVPRSDQCWLLAADIATSVVAVTVLMMIFALGVLR